ncbi:SAV_915 family protein [Kitasatospora aureofaciens]|uniref:SAV_915 family protein n=1 Tax=Kitasatospora aureofaciens TaxID=1894 RepID=UPI00068DEAC4|nr:SAV_915 family protein [Kitasatospora aureofaciens]HJD83532.1 hypothetical protein [Kitasatospora aureofaciens]
MEPTDASGGQRPTAKGLFVPVHERGRVHLIRLFRTPLGTRTVVGFTSRARLATALGGDQACVELAEPILRELVEPLGVTRLIVDPDLVAAPVPTRTVPSAVADRRPLEVEPSLPGGRRPAGAG